MCSTCTLNNSCIWTQYKSTDKPYMYIPVTNPCMQYKHYECTPQEHNSIYTHRHVVKINSFSVFIIHIALSLYLLNEMQTMAWYSWAWDHIDASTHTRARACAHTHTHILLTLGTLNKYTRGWVDITAIALIKSCVYPLFDCMDREKKHTSGKTVMKHHRHGYYRHTVQNTNSPCRYLFSSISIHYASECIIGV